MKLMRDLEARSAADAIAKAEKDKAAKVLVEEAIAKVNSPPSSGLIVRSIHRQPVQFHDVGRVNQRAGGASRFLAKKERKTNQSSPWSLRCAHALFLFSPVPLSPQAVAEADRAYALEALAERRALRRAGNSPSTSPLKGPLQGPLKGPWKPPGLAGAAY
jgi:hypothetical protein